MIVAAAGLALAACGAKTDAPAHLTIGPAGAQGLTKAAPMDAAALAAAFPALELVAGEGGVETGRFAIIAVKSGDEIVFTVAATPDGKRVHSAATRSPLVAGPAGETVGQARFADAAGGEVRYCGDEFFDGQPAFACSTGPDGRFWRVYLKLAAEPAAGAAELAETRPAQKAESPLVEMRWIAPQS